MNKKRGTISTLACNNCRLRKQKCSGELPCERCQKSNKICQFVEKRKRLGKYEVCTPSILLYKSTEMSLSDWNLIFNNFFALLSTPKPCNSYIFEVNDEEGLRHFSKEVSYTLDSLSPEFPHNITESDFKIYRYVYENCLTPVESTFPVASRTGKNAKSTKDTVVDLKSFQFHCNSMSTAHLCIGLTFALLYSKMGIQIELAYKFYIQANEELKKVPFTDYDIEYLRCRLFMGLLSLYFNDKETSNFWIKEVLNFMCRYIIDNVFKVFIAGNNFNWEINSTSEKNLLQERYLNQLHLRKSIWTLLLLHMALLEKNFNGDDVILKFSNPFDVNICNSEKKFSVSSFCVIYNQVVKFCNDPVDCNYRSKIFELHEKLLLWFDSLLDIKKCFNSLESFIQNHQVSNDWINGIHNLTMISWWLSALIKLHFFNNNSIYFESKFNISYRGTVQGSSLEIILLSIRALATILMIRLPENHQECPIVYSISTDLIVATVLNNAMSVILELLSGDRRGWCGNEEIRNLVISFYLKKVFLGVLKRRKNPFSQELFFKFEPLVESFYILD
ncbi:hypothetical protein HK099_000305 [Clydaea vesicula]|uniref:Zn(2)-C6 fungal-type domain-containing protein n=1 Tax=Clydaea vesicula TaxID=447962 RepID=A0AAD5XWL1_9FUNG|nr:hypothetical protein HK099_000305 [Clydaea vesicula]